MLNDYNEKFPWTTAAELEEYGMNKLLPAINYYNKQFREEGGDLYRMRKAIIATQVFDPMYLSTTTLEAASLLIDDLKHYEYSMFTPDFLSGMKEELILASEHSKKPFDWDSIDGSDAYKTRVQKKIRTKEIADDDEYDWKAKDPGERARRIYEWWIIRLTNGCGTDFMCFRVALRLIVLSQTSSCAVERIFSQLKEIKDACGPMLEDLLELRMWCRCNGIDLDEEFGI